MTAWLEHPSIRRVTPEELIATSVSRGRVTATPVYANRSVPHYHCAAMDGIAIKAALTFGASENRPVTLNFSQFQVVDTGDPIPENADAVVMVEEVRWLPSGDAELLAAATPWQHIRLAGEDLVATEMVLPSGHLIRSPDIAALLSCGVGTIAVRQRPRIVILPTGDELVDANASETEQSRLGAIVESNSHLIAGLVEEWGGAAIRGAIVPDRREAVRDALLQALDLADVVALNAGSSAGREDFVPQVIAELGQLLAHGIDIMPGKPAALGVIRGKPVIAIPGYPVSAWVVCEQLLQPMVRQLHGQSPVSAQRVLATMGRKTPSRMGNEEFVRVRAGRVGGRLVAVPLPRGAGLLNSVVRADGVVRIPANREGVEAGESVQVELLRPLENLERTLLAVGSHDLLLDLISEHLGRTPGGATLSSVHVGSLAGLAAIKRGECHLGGCHLIDTETGVYNCSWLRRFFSPGEVVLVRFCRRQQGLFTPRGNPLQISGLGDLVGGKVQFINRQQGSGTRQLLDFLLARAGIPPSEIAGYHRELYTHLAIAAAVHSGGADTGLGVFSAARALDLEFIPVGTEHFDLVVRADAMQLPGTQKMLDLLASREFRTEAEALGGYDLSEAGTVIDWTVD